MNIKPSKLETDWQWQMGSESSSDPLQPFAERRGGI